MDTREIVNKIKSMSIDDLFEALEQEIVYKSKAEVFSEERKEHTQVQKLIQEEIKSRVG